MQIHFDPLSISQASLLSALVEAEASLPANVESLEFPGRKITFPVVLDDRWNREALEKYMRSIRNTAVYLPSNIEYLARNNGLKSAQDALKKLVDTDWVSTGYIHATRPGGCSQILAYPRSRILPRLSVPRASASSRVTPGSQISNKAVKIDPRCRLVGQKMNPSRTFTPRVRIWFQIPCLFAF